MCFVFVLFQQLHSLVKNIDLVVLQTPQQTTLSKESKRVEIL